LNTFLPNFLKNSAFSQFTLLNSFYGKLFIAIKSKSLKKVSMKSPKPKKVASLAVLLIFMLSSTYLVRGNTTGAHDFQWEQEYAGPGQIGDSLTGLIQTSDGGYAFAGTSSPYSLTGLSRSGIITKTYSNGSLEWQTQYFYPSSFYPKCLGLLQTNDQGFIFGLSDNASLGFDILKLDAKGATQWNRTYPYSGCSVMILSNDGAYVFAGTNNSKVWLAKTDSVGNVQWYKDYEAKFDRGVTKLIQTHDGRFLMIGTSIINPYHEGSPATLEVLKIDSLGTLIRNQKYDVDNSDWEEHSIIQTNDNNYVIMDNTNTSVTIFKIDQNGVVQWTQNYPALGILNSIIETSDGGLGLAGVNSNSNSLLLMAKTDSSGKLEWHVTGGNLNKVPYSEFGVGLLFYINSDCIIESSDGSLIMAGIADYQNPYAATYFIIKTLPFLPTPTKAASLPDVPSTLPANIILPTIEAPNAHSTQGLSAVQTFILIAILTIVLVVSGLTLFQVFKRKP
jgi:hypothetical protein